MATANRPSFLFLVTDQHRADHLGCAGHPVLQTPNLDRIAREGVRFSRAYVNNPLCMPARSTLFNGLTPRAHGVRTNGIPLDDRFPTVPGILHQAGYRTHAVGKLHLRPFGLPAGVPLESLDPLQFAESGQLWLEGRIRALPADYYGFETADYVGGHGSGVFGDYVNWLRAQDPGAHQLLLKAAGEVPASGAEQSWKMSLPVALHYNTWIADRAVEFLERQADVDQPFFLWCSFPDPHHPYCPPRPWADLYQPDDVPPPVRREGELDDLPPHYRRAYAEPTPLAGRFEATRIRDEQLRDILALTYGMVSHVDAEIGRVMAALERLGLREDTVVVFLSDHGDMMGDHWMLNKGPFHFDGLLRVPLIWTWPGQIPEGVVARGLASHLDVPATVLDLAGLPLPEESPGWPGPTSPEAPSQPPAWPGRSLRPILTGQADAVRDALLVENDEDYLGLRLRTLVTDRYLVTAYPGQPYGELFDLREDPQQLHNRWGDPDLGDLRRELLVRLMEELALTDCALPRRLSHA